MLKTIRYSLFIMLLFAVFLMMGCTSKNKELSSPSVIPLVKEHTPNSSINNDNTTSQPSIEPKETNGYKKDWVSTAPTKQLLGTIKKLEIKDNKLMYLTLHVDKPFMENGVVKKGDTIRVFYNEDIPSKLTLHIGDRVIILTTSYVFPDETKVDWGGMFSTPGYLYEKNNKFYDVDGVHQEQFDDMYTKSEH
jgi:hypothetical protein